MATATPKFAAQVCGPLGPVSMNTVSMLALATHMRPVQGSTKGSCNIVASHSKGIMDPSCDALAQGTCMGMEGSSMLAFGKVLCALGSMADVDMNDSYCEDQYTDFEDCCSKSWSKC